jgi:hypothetical protein
MSGDDTRGVAPAAGINDLLREGKAAADIFWGFKEIYDTVLESGAEPSCASAGAGAGAAGEGGVLGCSHLVAGVWLRLCAPTGSGAQAPPPPCAAGAKLLVIPTPPSTLVSKGDSKNVERLKLIGMMEAYARAQPNAAVGGAAARRYWLAASLTPAQVVCQGCNPQSPMGVW